MAGAHRGATALRRAWAPVLLVGAAAVVVGCGYLRREPAPDRPRVYYTPPDAAAAAGGLSSGEQLYLRDCAFCHSDDGRGTTRGPNLTVETNGGALTDFVLRTGRMPVATTVEQMKPRKPFYNEQEIEAIVSYVTARFQGPGPPVPDIDLRRGTLATGQQVYQDNCAPCHATTGIGGAMLIGGGGSGEKLRGIVIPDFARSDVRAVAEAVRTGPGAMPVFGERAISNYELDSLLKYMSYLKKPRDEGGAPIGRVGPVVEGAVGWLVGLGLLMLVIRWIGTKAGEVE